jgi:HMG (high mobility group) box
MSGLGSRHNNIRGVFTDDLQLSPGFFDGRTHEEVSPPSGSGDYGAPKIVKAEERSGWKEDTTEDGMLRPPGDKPKRPLSAYNFFFQLERERIIESPPDERDKVVEYKIEDVHRIAALQLEKAKAGKPKEKRSHRKTHGKISFGDLARTIANKWKHLDESKKVVFEGSANEEKERYRRELQEWNKKQKKWKEATAKMTHHHHNLFDRNIVTPTQHPRATLPTDQHVMTTLMKQQKRLLEESGFVSGSSPSSLTPNSEPNHRQVFADDLVRSRRVSTDFYDRPPSYSDRTTFGERAPFGERVSLYGSSPSSVGERSYSEFFSGDGRRSDPFFNGSSASSSVHDYGRHGEAYQPAGSRLPNYQHMWLQQRRMQYMEEQQHHQRYGGYDFDSPRDRGTQRMPSPTGHQTALRGEPDGTARMSPHPYHQDDFAETVFSRTNEPYTAL